MNFPIKNKKGFLFVVTVFLILTYILLSISVWVKAVETAERSYSEFYKESTVELAIEQITPAKLDNVTSIIMNRALFRLNEHAINYEVLAGPPGDENANIRAAMKELLLDGTANESHFRGAEGIPIESDSSLSAWVSNLNASLLAIGIYVSDFEVSNFDVSQSGLDKLAYSFDVDLNLRDYSNTASVSRRYHISNTLLIDGLVDPALARESSERTHDESTVYRQFFFNKDDYGEPSSILIDNLGDGEGGQGWMYGYLTSTSDAASVPAALRRNYILVGDFADINGLGMELYDQFGAYIVTDRPGHPSACMGKSNEDNTFNPLEYSGPACDEVGISCGDGICTGKPFIVAPSFSLTSSSVPDCPRSDGAMAKCALIIAAYAPEEVSESGDPENKLETEGTGVYGIEDLRDFVLCGYYTYNADAPSYFQRLLEDSYSRNSSEFGIESFVIGEYVNSSSYYLNSRLDRELFNDSIEGIKIRGLPGCRTFGSCAGSPTTGIFALSEYAVRAYGLESIACTSGAGCD